MRPIKPTTDEIERFGADIIFIGTYAKGEKRVEYLEKLCENGYDVKVFGTQWRKCRECKCLKKTGSLAYKAYYGKDFSRVVNSGKIIVSFLREHDKDVLDSRTFELPACKAFMLHWRTKEAMGFFEEEKEAEFFGSFDELRKKIDYYLEHKDERKKIAEAGHKKVQEYDCGFVSRAEKMLGVFNEMNRK